MKKKITFLILFLILILSLYLAICAGYKDAGINLFNKLFNLNNDSDSLILTLLRLPRALKAFIAGSALALAGMFMQATTKNPLAEPYLTGVSAGAGLGIVLAILFFNSLTYSICGFFGALVSSVLVILFAGLSRFSISKLILVGLSINIFASAFISLIILLNPQKSYTMVLILSGGVTSNEIVSNNILLILFGVIVLMSLFFIPKLNFLRLDSKLIEANENKKYLYDIISVALAALLTSISVFCAGIIGFIGIVAPQISKVLFGMDYRCLFFSNIIIGSSLILFADFLSRSLIYPLQIPLGLIVAFIGAPVFVYFIVKKGTMFND